MELYRYMTINKTPKPTDIQDINDDVRQRFADNLRRWRDIHGITQAEMAEKTGLAKQYLSNVERCTNNISLDNMRKIANALDVQLYVLLLAKND